MKVMVTGATGQLGYDIMRELKRRDIEAVGLGSKDCDITNASEVVHIIDTVKPDAVIHCAGYTAVDKAEEESEKCQLINVDGTHNIALACKKPGIKLLYVSTDYVFDGEGTEPWKPEDECDPINQYGLSKYLGEQEVVQLLEKYFIVRISWVFGINGRNFVKSVLTRAKTCKALNVVSDQIGSPTYTVDIAKVMVDMIFTDEYGIYNVTNEGFCSWYEFACEIFQRMGQEVSVTPISSKTFAAKAKRPNNSRMDKSKLEEHGFSKLPHWKNALSRFLDEMPCPKEKEH